MVRTDHSRLTSATTSTASLSFVTNIKLPRSRSSPSPPASRAATRRGDTSRQQARRKPSAISTGTNGNGGDVAVTALDWSTSYQAGSSSSQSRESSVDDDTDDEVPVTARGRTYSQSTARNGSLTRHISKNISSSTYRKESPHPNSSGESSGPGPVNNRIPFTRSRSPVVFRASTQRKLSPIISSFPRHRSSLTRFRHILPAAFELNLRVPFTSYAWTLSIDARRAGECLTIIGSLVYATSKIWEDTDFRSSRFDSRQCNLWILTELHLLAAASILYMLWVHNALMSPSKASPPKPPSPQSPSLSLNSPRRPSSPRIPDIRDPKRSPALQLYRKKSDFGFVWMSVPKNFRNSSDDGILTGLLFGPLVSCALLYSSLSLSPSTNPLPSSWIIEPPVRLNNAIGGYTALEALVLSRYNLVDLANLCSTILLFHVCASWWLEGRYRGGNAPESERISVPRGEGRRFIYYVIFTLGTTLGMLGIKYALQRSLSGIWQHLSWLELIFSSLFYQFTLYGAVRLAHRGFTLGELGLVCFGGTALFMEFLNITRANIWPLTTPFIKTYRLPTPLLVFQTALVAGSFLTGFMVSPFLILSRHIGQRPVRRMRYPEQKLRYRRLLALGFYIGSFIVIFGLIGMWTRWCLGKRDPWLWVIFWLLDGRKKWSRPALLAYWAALGSLSVAGWNRQLARSRKFRTWSLAGENLIIPGTPASIVGAASTYSTGAALLDNSSPSQQGSGSDTPAGALASGANTMPSGPASSTTSTGALGLTFPNLPNLPTLPQFPNGATDLLDAADKHVPTLGLNARRKFFHALTVVMFVPGVAFDPAFTHLCFSAAFALFTFAEYVRYFAIYPFGAVVHLFINEFLDHKDSGTAILSHFYLLTGCAGSLWLEGSSPLLQFTGILVLGVGDALASIVGKRIGIHRWSPTTGKTLEGSFAFTLSVVMCAWILRLFGMVESFSTLRYATVIGISSVLEALSDQNDNLTLPLFAWSLLALS